MIVSQDVEQVDLVELKNFFLVSLQIRNRLW